MEGEGQDADCSLGSLLRAPKVQGREGEGAVLWLRVSPSVCFQGTTHCPPAPALGDSGHQREV